MGFAGGQDERAGAGLGQGDAAGGLGADGHGTAGSGVVLDHDQILTVARGQRAAGVGNETGETLSTSAPVEAAEHKSLKLQGVEDDFETVMTGEESGPAWIRTRNQGIMSPLLCR